MEHPIWERPKEDGLEEFILHSGDTSHKDPFRKVTRAWEKVHVKENKLERKDTSSEEFYTPWVKEMVRLIKLPFVFDPTYVPNMLGPILVSIEETGRLIATIVGSKQDREGLEHSLYETTYEKNQISYDLEQMDKQLLKNMEELQAERKGEVQYIRDLTITAQIIVQEQGDWAEAWRVEHSNLVEFSNNLVRDIPRMYKRVDGVANFHNTPQDVLEFIRLCDIMLKEFRAHLKVAMEASL
ncbi:hypothetical protein KIW84_057550 [Lathyrus oleraceus]|uniref:DUF7745 domain-containing protein n=1 Tax=Pisum sativum TaxID=3888 RepID=A0A9D5AID7_PEA|nr:hypothetical protein KIW84_057550 [Pisum sativum]